MIYLDNAATTRKKPISVIWAVLKALTIYNANPSRGSHKASIKAGLKVLSCREHLKQFVNAPTTAEVVYTFNCTEAINIALNGCLNENDHVIITTFEHNAVARTLHHLTQRNITYSIVKPDSYNNITLLEIEKLVTQKTKLIIVNQTSNVTGTTTKLTEIGNYCKLHNILFMVDGAQSAGHEDINVSKNNINLLCLAGHKGLYGTQGIGALIINNVEPKPLKFGGSGTNSKLKTMPDYYPDKLEAGTTNLVGIMALDGGIKFVEKHKHKINKKTLKLATILYNYLKQNPNIIIYTTCIKSGVISFNIKNKNTDEVVNFLNDYGICVRGGLHCAPLAHMHLNTINSGTIRVSISYFNTAHEIKKLIKALKKIA